MAHFLANRALLLCHASAMVTIVSTCRLLARQQFRLAKEPIRQFDRQAGELRLRANIPFLDS